MNTKYMVVIVAMAVMLIGATALATSERAFAGGHGHKKSYEKNQATSQANACGNGKLPMNVFCQNIGSQVQGDEKNAVALDGAQQVGDYRHSGGHGGGNGVVVVTAVVTVTAVTATTGKKKQTVT